VNNHPTWLSGRDTGHGRAPGPAVPRGRASHPDAVDRSDDVHRRRREAVVRATALRHAVPERHQQGRMYQAEAPGDEVPLSGAGLLYDRNVPGASLELLRLRKNQKPSEVPQAQEKSCCWRSLTAPGANRCQRRSPDLCLRIRTL
jgi:hypothetical protein